MQELGMQEIAGFAMSKQITRALVLIGLTWSCAAPASAQAPQIRIGVQPGMSYLPFYVMEHERLLEQRLSEAGLPANVIWKRFANGPAMNDGILSGALDIVGTGIPSFLTLWAKARGPLEVKGLAAYGSVPTLLVTRSPNVKSIADFTDKDRIAVPAAKNSLQALLLQMEARKVFGPKSWSKLDHLMISRGHPDAMIGLLSKSSEITAHFSASPYYVQELKDPAVHVILTADQIVGHPVSNGMLYLRTSFYSANRSSIKQFLAAMDDAFALIRRDPKSAGLMYVDLSGDKTKPDDIASIITSPGSGYEAAPRGIKALSDFMKDVGLLDRSISKWSDVFIEEIQGLPGD
jgi:NitT/TauT family transport system substrate-binding protein